MLPPMTSQARAPTFRRCAPRARRTSTAVQQMPAPCRKTERAADRRPNNTQTHPYTKSARSGGNADTASVASLARSARSPNRAILAHPNDILRRGRGRSRSRNAPRGARSSLPILAEWCIERHALELGRSDEALIDPQSGARTGTRHGRASDSRACERFTGKPRAPTGLKPMQKRGRPKRNARPRSEHRRNSRANSRTAATRPCVAAMEPLVYGLVSNRSAL